MSSAECSSGPGSGENHQAPDPDDPLNRLPTPVRDLEHREDARSGGSDAHPEPRTVRVGEELWDAEIAGATLSGTGGDRGAPLLLLHFTRTDGERKLSREVLAIGTDLDSFSDHELRRLFDRSRPSRLDSTPSM